MAAAPVTVALRTLWPLRFPVCFFWLTGGVIVAHLSIPNGSDKALVCTSLQCLSAPTDDLKKTQEHDCACNTKGWEKQKQDCLDWLCYFIGG